MLFRLASWQRHFGTGIPQTANSGDKKKWPTPMGSFVLSSPLPEERRERVSAFLSLWPKAETSFLGYAPRERWLGGSTRKMTTIIDVKSVMLAANVNLTYCHWALRWTLRLSWQDVSKLKCILSLLVISTNTATNYLNHVNWCSHGYDYAATSTLRIY